MAKKSKSKYGNFGKDLRDLQIIEKAAAGERQGKIAEEHGISRQRVNMILNSDEAKRLVDQARSELQTYASEAVLTLYEAMLDRHKNMAVAVQAATTLLKGLGVFSEKSEVSLKPFVMHLLDGSEIHMGHKPSNERNS